MLEFEADAECQCLGNCCRQSRGRNYANFSDGVLAVSGERNPRNSSCQESRFAACTFVITGITNASEHSIPNAWHLESRACLASERTNILADARAVPEFWQNASTARITRISTAINTGQAAEAVRAEYGSKSASWQLGMPTQKQSFQAFRMVRRFWRGSPPADRPKPRKRTTPKTP